MQGAISCWCSLKCLVNLVELIKILFQCFTFPALCIMSVAKEKTSGISDSEFVQVGCGISGIWCILCHLLCCFGMFDWDCSLLLFALHYCNSLCCCWPGMIKEWFTMIDSIRLDYLTMYNVYCFCDQIGRCIWGRSQYASKIQVWSEQWRKVWCRSRHNVSHRNEQWILGKWTHSFTWGCGELLFYCGTISLFPKFIAYWFGIPYILFIYIFLPLLLIAFKKLIIIIVTTIISILLVYYYFHSST